jgi:hypothetical protein
MNLASPSRRSFLAATAASAGRVLGANDRAWRSSEPAGAGSA